MRIGVRRIAEEVLGAVLFFPLTLYLNLRTLPFRQAVRLPIFLCGPCRLSGLRRGSIRIAGCVRFGMVRIGSRHSERSGIAVLSRSRIVVRQGGEIVFDGAASLGRGTGVCADGGTVRFGKNFSCNVNCFFASSVSVSFGDDVLLGWNINVRDDDGHPIRDADGRVVNPPAGVSVGDHVWIASCVDILKGVCLSDGVIVGYRSLVTKSVCEKNCLVLGSPAEVKEKNVFWSR